MPVGAWNGAAVEECGCANAEASRPSDTLILWQGTHSLQLHSQLEVMSLKTDRGLHVDAQMCHRLLSFLAQKKRLREVQVCSGYYSLQSIQGDRDLQDVPTLWLLDLGISGMGLHAGDKPWHAVFP